MYKQQVCLERSCVSNPSASAIASERESTKKRSSHGKMQLFYKSIFLRERKRELFILSELIIRNSKNIPQTNIDTRKKQIHCK